ncbi:AraC family transcriptional regulator [Pluralibacter gergoviae]|uniref:AraC-like transcriptional regulator QhpR n=1 Tax=Pluralibacter gergoviae TaxID=61647 RepID=UPI0005ED2688|nr:AraC family transcriptional regulator [Pluralibacter gergoviae]KJM61655.1 AraC family transcriptional regulator [Pluralibacter gergoviae]KMK17143.1 AraC family transcriptional regulator [Pluralibacter gergoviae]OUQ98368.1 AraC family transcriptional regulator [Pluralibacter gergoviae]
MTSAISESLTLAMPAAGGHRGVLSAAASGLCDFIKARGGDADRILGISGIDPELLSCPTLSLDLVSYCKVMEVAARQADVDNFGLYYGNQFRPQSLGLIGYIGLCSPTLETALRNVVNAFPFHQHDTFIRLTERGECLQLDYQVRHGAILARRQDAELTLGMFMNIVRHVLGKSWAPREVHFEHPRPQQWHEHCKLFDAPVYFDQPFNSLIIPRRDLQRPMPEHDPMLLLVMQDAIRRINAPAAGQGCVNQTRTQIHLQLVNGEPSLEIIADRLNLSPWSLQRRLKEESTSFTALVDSVRKEMATHYLEQPNLPVSEMALLLGYSEVSAFSRAFRRWFGCSPSRCRQAGGARG